MSNSLNILHKSQIGFLPNNRTADHVLTLRTLIDKYVNCHHEKVYACFVDFRKAFDSVWHDGLLYKLLQNNVIVESISYSYFPKMFILVPIFYLVFCVICVIFRCFVFTESKIKSISKPCSKICISTNSQSCIKSSNTRNQNVRKDLSLQGAVTIHFSHGNAN